MTRVLSTRHLFLLGEDDVAPCAQLLGELVRQASPRKSRGLLKGVIA